MNQLVAMLTRGWLSRRGQEALSSTAGFSQFIEGVYYARWRAYRPLRLLIAFVLFFLLFGPKTRAAAVIGCAAAVFLALHAWRARAIAMGLALERHAPGFARQGQRVRVELVLVNGSAFAVDNLVLVDWFGGAQRPAHAVKIESPVPAGGSRTVSYEAFCDGETGLRPFGELTAVVSDPFGFFRFEAKHATRDSMRIHPQARPIPEIPVQGWTESFDYGPFEVPRATSASVTLLGIREYRAGDPVRNISWRLSARRQRLLVKEFEKSVNANVTLLLNLDAACHAGYGRLSSWEYAESVAVSIANQQFEDGNLVQVLANGLYLPFGKGPDHERLALTAMSDLAPDPKNGSAAMIARCAALVPHDSTLIYISPTYGEAVRRNIEEVLKLKALGIRLHFVLIDSMSFMSDYLAHTFGFGVLLPKIALAGNALVARLRQEGVYACSISRDEPMARSLLSGYSEPL